MAEEFTPQYTFTDDRLNELKQLFPEAFEDGVFNLNTLKELIGEYSTDSSVKEHFGLNWVGKQDARRIAAKAPTGTLKPCPGEGVNEDATENIFIEGENLEVLKILRKSYMGKIKMIYIDPPYNTGNDFIYNDSFADSTEDFLRKTGEKSDEGLLVSNPKSSGKYHANWLTFIYPRLRLAKDLLKDDGVIFISIDHNEFDNLKKLCDEIFGEENFIAIINVINNFKGRSDDKYIATANEFLLFYQKGNFVTNGVPIPEEYIKEYKLVDGDRKYRHIGLRKRGDGARKEDRPNMFFPIYFNVEENIISLNKETEEFIEILPKLSDGSLGRWRWGKSTVKDRIDELEAKFISTREEYDIFQKDFLTDKEGNFKSVKPKSFWLGPEFSTENGTLEYKKLFKSKAFENPKPIGLILNCLYQAISGADDYVLDFFSGSGTTGQSVFEFNNVSGKRTKFILVQLPVLIDEKHTAYKKGYKTISEISKDRLKLSIEEYKYKQGFKVFKQSTSTIYKWQEFMPDQDGALPDLFNSLELAYKNPLQDGVTTQDFITEVILQEGFPLTANQEEVMSGIFKITHEWVPYTLYATMLYSFKDTDFSKLQLLETDHFVCLDKAFEGNDALKQELDNQCKLFTI
ncbi:site-specific DNA-methyltransferase [Muriicola soli]|uniref:site-specific DNA-methyltransferase (adenine-specific) n=1 Tax=Muriicola soli TaxID=2507538 RepID=A0A411E7I2_9FLAO|nr:site-specific DNA-methyltransferase [Muriicola soli]QBA63661.1 site-specific DNA-methyltransferase [Muriicola soli]